MDFKNIPVTYYPAYTWLWNTTVTDEETKRQIDEMYDAGIRAFYALAEPENFLPVRRKTFLSPEYMSPEYIERVHYASSYAKEKGMHTWLYNEGGFPSGMVCGQIRKMRPDLARIDFVKNVLSLPKGIAYKKSDGALAGFIKDKYVKEGEVFSYDTEITEYTPAPSNNWVTHVRTDNARPENTKLFLELTHEKWKKRFGDSFGSDVNIMFDDEADMGDWTKDFDKIFYEEYGYDFIPFIATSIRSGLTPETKEAMKARSDYNMLCAKLLHENYFLPMKKWLNENNMLSAGHLGGDSRSEIPLLRMGNALRLLRTYDIPGVDVIWSQITYPSENGKSCFEGYEFFPALASSAARHTGHSLAVSECFAVYGAHITNEEMRYIVNYQAALGISLFNFMVMSYDRKNAMSLQYRPSFIGENPSMDSLSTINNYTARLSYILQNSKADIKTALYFPQRSIGGSGAVGNASMKSFEDLGHMLMAKGVSFDLIDEEFVENAKVENSSLVGEFVTYENVFVPNGEFEPEEVMKKLSLIKSEFTPVAMRENEKTNVRHLFFDDGNEAYFIVNTAGDTVNEKIKIKTDKNPSVIDLNTGELYEIAFEREGEFITIAPTLLRGEAIMLYLTKEALNLKKRPIYEDVLTLTDFTSFVSRKYLIDDNKGPYNEYFTSGEIKKGLYEWDSDFSGEVTYEITLPSLKEGEYALSLGDVRHVAKIYINGEKRAEAVMPPYEKGIGFLKGGEKLKIVVANTAANVTRSAPYFDLTPIANVGPYHTNMKKAEMKAPSGGLLGPVILERVI